MNWDSCGRKLYFNALRTSSTASTMHILWALMVTLATLASVCFGVPAGGIFYTKRNEYFALRVPPTAAVHIVWTGMVTSTTMIGLSTIPTGGIIVTIKVAICSPYLDYDYRLACYIHPDGYVGDGYGVWWNSGGRICLLSVRRWRIQCVSCVPEWLRQHQCILGFLRTLISMIYNKCDIDILYIANSFYFLEVLEYETQILSIGLG